MARRYQRAPSLSAMECPRARTAYASDRVPVERDLQSRDKPPRLQNTRVPKPKGPRHALDDLAD